MSADAWILEYIVQTWWFWVVLVVWGAFSAFICTDDYSDDFEKVMLPIISLLFAAAAWIVGCLIFNIFIPHHDETSRHELAILNDKTSVSGQFALGSGTIDDEAAFSFYTQGDGYNQFVVLTGPNARVYQDLKPGQTPWLITFDGCKLWGGIATCLYNKTVINEIHVPPNTIKPTLELDAK